MLGFYLIKDLRFNIRYIQTYIKYMDYYANTFMSYYCMDGLL